MTHRTPPPSTLQTERSADVADPSAPPDETTPPIDRRALVKAIAVGVAIVVAVNAAFVVAMRQVTVNRGYETIRQKWQLTEQQDEPVDWLLVGDSSCNQGLDPRVFVDSLDQSALNLCTTGDLLVVGDAWFAQHYIDEVGPPRRGIIMTHAYDVWPRGGEAISATAWVIPGSDRWRRSRPLVNASVGERVLGLVGPWFPLYAQPASVKRIVLDPQDVLAEPALALTTEGFRQSGPPDEDEVAADIRRHSAPVEPEDLAISDLNMAALQALADLALSEQVPLIVSPSPLVEELWSDPTFRLRYDAATAAVEAFARDQPNVYLLQDEPWLYPASDMQNADHVAEPTAARHTQAVIASLEQVELARP